MGNEEWRAGQWLSRKPQAGSLGAGQMDVVSQKIDWVPGHMAGLIGMSGRRPVVKAEPLRRSGWRLVVEAEPLWRLGRRPAAKVEPLWSPAVKVEPPPGDRQEAGCEEGTPLEVSNRAAGLEDGNGENVWGGCGAREAGV